MEFHDYRLRSYQVAEFGSLITLDLVYDYPGLQAWCIDSALGFKGIVIATSIT